MQNPEIDYNRSYYGQELISGSLKICVSQGIFDMSKIFLDNFYVKKNLYMILYNSKIDHIYCKHLIHLYFKF